MAEKKVKNDILVKLHSEGYSDKQLCEYFNVPNQWISIKRRKLGLIENKDSTKIKSLTNEEHEVLLGLLLGDGHLIKTSFTDRGGTSGTIVHSIKQEEYLKWISNKLNRFVTPIRREINYNNIRKKSYERVICNINTHHCLNYYYNLFYDKNKKKHITPEIINQLTPLSLAVWFMDDGSKASSGGYTIYTNCFDKEEQELILPILSEKFNLKLSLNKNNSKEYNKTYHYIYISSKSAKIFESIIEPYIIESMKYKINKKNTGGTDI